MTAKEKALELCVKFFKPSIFGYEEKQYLVDEERAKQFALICVDEIINCNTIYMEGCYVKYWEKVKQKINKL